MNIVLNEQRTACCREAFRQTKIVQEQAECIVPDVLEDVGQIVSAQAQLCLKSKDLTDHGAVVGASAEISVFYITESRERVRCMSFSKDLEIRFDSPAIEPDAAAEISLSCLGVQARAVNPRKLAAQLAVRSELVCWTEGCFSVPTGAAEEENGALQLRQGSEECVFTARLSEKSFVVNEQLPMDAQAEPTALSCACVKLQYNDHQPIGSKLLLKGGAELSIAYETEKGSRPQFLRQCLPFSVLIDMPDEDCFLGGVDFEPTALYADLGDAINGSRVIELELHATAQVRFERRSSVVYLADAYGTDCPAIIERSTLPICRSRSEERLTANASDRFRVEKERGEIVSSFSDVLSWTVRDGRAELSASVGFLLLAEDGSFSAQQRLLSFDSPLPDPLVQICGAQITALHASREGDEIVIDAAAVFDCERRELAELSFLSSVDLDTEHAYDPASLPSLSIARRGSRDLWELAKLYHSSVGAIEAMARDHPMAGDFLLIPRV